MPQTPYKIQLPAFEGPLDLLLHLIEKNQIDIYDIPIAELTEQYLAYLSAMEEFNIDVASDFLLMAATLLQIKSRLLLPKPPKIEAAENDEFDPRQELVDRLLEYRKFKQMAALLGEMTLRREQYVTRAPQLLAATYELPSGLNVDLLTKAFLAVWESGLEDYAIVNREEISIQDKIHDIIQLLHKYGGRLEFSQTIIRSGTKSEVIAAFLALLELIKLQRVSVKQKNSFAPIYIMLKE